MRFKSGRVSGVHYWLVPPGRKWQMTSRELLEALGLPPGRAIPPDLDLRAEVLGMEVHVRPKTKRGMEKRIFCKCPDCPRWIEAGHIHQHFEAHHH